MSFAPWLVVAVVGMFTTHTCINALLLRRPPTVKSTVGFPVSILLPLRDEANRVRPCLEALLRQRGVPRAEIVVLDDASTDGTADVVRAVAGGDPRVRLVTGVEPPPGWLGKPHACHQLAGHADPAARVLVFLDADVVLDPEAVAAAVALLEGFELVSPYPKIVAVGGGERLVQPLLQWSWLTFLPLRAMERSRRPALAAAGGQFLVVTRSGYERAGGHAAVRDRVLEDIELARAVKRSGGRVALADGSRIAACRMYTSWRDLVNGYTKSLWASFSSPTLAAIVVVSLLLLYAVPPVFAVVAFSLGASEWAVAGVTTYLLGVLGRFVSGRATGARVWPDALAHPASVVLLVGLAVRSFWCRRRGKLVWKDRGLPD
jgi:glycosyltransferase involved in cell wall biosynthesis